MMLNARPCLFMALLNLGDEEGLSFRAYVILRESQGDFTEQSDERLWSLPDLWSSDHFLKTRPGMTFLSCAFLPRC